MTRFLVRALSAELAACYAAVRFCLRPWLFSDGRTQGCRRCRPLVTQRAGCARTGSPQSSHPRGSAFESEEKLAKKLVHERVHVEDLRGRYAAAEVRAEAIADAWWASFR